MNVKQKSDRIAFVIAALACCNGAATYAADPALSPQTPLSTLRQAASLTPAQAVMQAEGFIVENGYTSAPATISKKNLAHETVEFARSTDDLLKQRRSTLVPTACAYGAGRTNGAGGANGWTVVFRYRNAPANAPTGRAVTMDLDGGRKRVEHKDARRAAWTPWPADPAASQQTPAVAPAPLPATKPNSVWVTDGAFAPKLAPVTDAGGGFQVQPPIGYVLQTTTAPNNAGSVRAWVSPARPDGTHGFLMVTVITPPAAEADKYPLATVLDKMLEGIARRRTNGKRTVTESGTVAGQAFVRARWEGTDAATGLLMRGFSYVTRNGGTFIHLSSQDIAPHDKDALPLAEAAALTFKKPLAPSGAPAVNP